MSALVSMGACPFCQNGTNTPCFATYVDGYHCYTCGKHKSASEKHYAFRTLKPIQKQLNLPQLIENPCKFSISVLQWLYKYFIYEGDIQRHNIYYVPPIEGYEESIVFGNKELTFWQRRFFPSKKFITRGDKTQVFVLPSLITSNKIILVEDIISAIRVSKYANVICLFGTHMNYLCRKFLEKSIYNIFIWLDPDKPGQDASNIMLNILTKSLGTYTRYRAFAVREQRTIKILNTEKQPKDYCDQELKLIVGEIN